MEQKTDYYLVLDTWVNGYNTCGATGNNICMLNSAGNSCCLGQFAAQVSVEKRILRTSLGPEHVAHLVDKVYDSNFVTGSCEDGFCLTDLAKQLIDTNDAFPLRPDHERAERIKTILSKHGITLKIANTKSEL